MQHERTLLRIGDERREHAPDNFVRGAKPVSKNKGILHDERVSQLEHHRSQKNTDVPGQTYKNTGTSWSTSPAVGIYGGGTVNGLLMKRG